MGKVVTVDADVRCSHAPGGPVTLQAGQQVLYAGDSLVVARTIAGMVIGEGCNLASVPQTPCKKADSELPGGASQVLQVGGTPVELDSANGQTDAGGTWKVTSAGQDVLNAD